MGIEQGFFSLPLIDIQVKDSSLLQSNARVIRAWMRSLAPGELREFKLQKSRALRLMQLDNRHHFYTWLQSLDEGDQSCKMKIYNDVNRALARNFGIPLTEITPTLERYADESNSSITAPRDRMPNDISGRFEMINEVELYAHPIDLLRIVFDPRYSRKAGFEAVRKLGHMEEAAQVEGDPVLSKKREDYIKFTQILNEHVWMKDQKIGEIGEIYFLSTHDPDNNFACTSVEIREINFDEADKLSQQLPSNQKLVVASRRRFQVQSGPQKGRVVDIYISNRLKTNVDRRVKSERKNNGDDPHNSNKDAIGARIVADTKEELELFIAHLSFVADKIGSDIKIHDYQDSIDGGDFNGDNPGSSKDVQMIKFLVRIANIELEMQAYESIGFANASFKRGPSRPEYWWKRLFNSGWFNRNFPTSIYHYDTSILQRGLIRHERELIEGRQQTATCGSSANDLIVPPKSTKHLGRLLITIATKAGAAFGHAQNHFRS